jgi:ACS family glucarate transporter-like MFS transporter
MISVDGGRPTRVRWRILALLFAVSVITYIDRLNISVTARQMMPALGLTELQMGQVFSAFVIGYALFQIPGGWLGDRWGARRILTLAVVWWSIFTALTATAATLPLAGWLGAVGTLFLVRFLVGVGEAAALPNFNRAVANWLPSRERGLGIGVAIGGIGIGSAMTPPLTAWIMVNFGWQTAFYLAGALGLLVAAAWWLYASDRPRDHPEVNLAEVRLIEGQDTTDATLSGPASVPWALFRRTPTVWWLILSYTCLGYVAYVYMSWFYLYLVNVRGFGVLRGALYASGPFIAISLFCPLGGWATDWLAAHFGVTVGRATAGAGGMVMSGFSILLGAVTDAPYLAILLLSLGAGWLYFSVGAYWSATTDLSKAHAGLLSGMMNTGANVGGSLSPTLTPWLAEHFGWSAALGVAAGTALIGGLMWLGIKPGEGLRTK